MLHTVVISDIHLSENEPSDGLWMRYRQAPFAPDAEVAALLDAVSAKLAEGDQATLVLNGDVFDFDAPRVDDGASYFHDFPRDGAHDAPATERILDDHPVFVEAIGRFLADGHRVVLISGNHDTQMTLPAVRDVVRRRFVNAAGGDAASRVEFRAWFLLTEDGVLIEHGHQYDPYCAYRYPVEPFAPAASTAEAEPAIQPTMGSLATRLLTGRMGYFNPHVDQTYTLGPVGYFRHWLRRYLFSKHSLGFAWFFGSIRTALALSRGRDPGDDARAARHRAAAAEDCPSVDPSRLERHMALFAPPAEEAMRRILRELYLDRVAAIVACGLFAVAWWLGGPSGTWWVAFVPAIAAILYESRLPGATVHDRWRGVDDAMERVAAVHGARAVLFGHTHHEHARFTPQGQFFANLGTWSSAWLDIECTKRAHEERPFVWLRSDGRTLSGGLHAFVDGQIEERVVGEIETGTFPANAPRRPPTPTVVSTGALNLLGRVEIPSAPDSLGGIIADITGAEAGRSISARG